jgi:tetratricopeptide (TPR) repeat protein
MADKEDQRVGDGSEERGPERAERVGGMDMAISPASAEDPPQHALEPSHSSNRRAGSPSPSAYPPASSTVVSPVPNQIVSNPPPGHFRPEVACTDLGTQLKLMGKVKEGMAKYAEAIRLNSNYAPAYYNIAVVYSESRNYEEAIRFYKMAIERNPNYIEAYCNIGTLILVM